MTAVYTVREVAALMRCSEQTVRRSIEAGELPVVRLMGVTRIPVHAFAALTDPHGLPSANSASSSCDSAIAGGEVEFGAGEPTRTSVLGEVADERPEQADSLVPPASPTPSSL